MVMANDWLADIVLVNESRDEGTAGDISIFRSAGEACLWLEDWWVENGEGFAFTASGARLTLGVDGAKRVVVTGQHEIPGGTDVVLAWLRASATALLSARRAKARKGNAALSPSEEVGLMPVSVEGLIAYVGFRN
jgi:hypothetical protein